MSMRKETGRVAWENRFLWLTFEAVKPKRCLMINLIRPGRMIFALGTIALGTLQFFTRTFIVGRPVLPAWLAGEGWAYASGILLIIAGLLVILNKKPGETAFAT